MIRRDSREAWEEGAKYLSSNPDASAKEIARETNLLFACARSLLARKRDRTLPLIPEDRKSSAELYAIEDRNRLKDAARDAKMSDIRDIFTRNGMRFPVRRYVGREEILLLLILSRVHSDDPLRKAGINDLFAPFCKYTDLEELAVEAQVLVPRALLDQSTYLKNLELKLDTLLARGKGQDRVESSHLIPSESAPEYSETSLQSVKSTLLEIMN